MAYCLKKLQALLVGRDDSESHYLGMRQNRVGVPLQSSSSDARTCVLKIEKKVKFAVLTNSEGKFLTARGKDVVLTDTLEDYMCRRSNWSTSTKIMKKELSKSEWKVMKIVWSLQKAMAREIYSIACDEQSWSQATVRTLLARLVEKGVEITLLELDFQSFRKVKKSD